MNRQNLRCKPSSCRHGFRPQQGLTIMNPSANASPKSDKLHCFRPQQGLTIMNVCNRDNEPKRNKKSFRPQQGLTIMNAYILSFLQYSMF